MQLCLKWYLSLLWRSWVWATSLRAHWLVAALRLWGCVLLGSQAQHNAGITVLQHRPSTDLPWRLEPSHTGEQGGQESKSVLSPLCWRSAALCR